MERGMLAGGLLVILIGIGAIARYASLGREYPEARPGFDILLLLSVGVLAVFTAGFIVLLRRDRQAL